MNKGSRESGSIRKLAPPTGMAGQGRRTAGDPVSFESEDPMSRLIAVVSNVAELGLFFGAAIVLGAGLLSLR